MSASAVCAYNIRKPGHGSVETRAVLAARALMINRFIMCFLLSGLDDGKTGTVPAVFASGAIGLAGPATRLTGEEADPGPILGPDSPKVKHSSQILIKPQNRTCAAFGDRPSGVPLGMLPGT